MIKTNLQLKLKCWIVFAVTLCCFSPQLCAQSQHRIIEILADRDSRYKIAGQKQPVITAKPGEELTLRITARKAQTQDDFRWLCPRVSGILQEERHDFV